MPATHAEVEWLKNGHNISNVKLLNSLVSLFPEKTQTTHVNFDKPPSLAKSAKSEEGALSYFRRVRDEIRIFIETLPLK